MMVKCAAGFYAAQFVESYMSPVYKNLENFVDADEAKVKINNVLSGNPELKVSFSVGKDKPETKTKDLKVRSMDASNDVKFFDKLDFSQMNRIAVQTHYFETREAAQKLSKLTAGIKGDKVSVSKNVKGAEEFYIADEKPWWANQGVYFAATAFGLSPLIRYQLDGNAKTTDFHAVKVVNNVRL